VPQAAIRAGSVSGPEAPGQVMGHGVVARASNGTGEHPPSLLWLPAPPAWSSDIERMNADAPTPDLPRGAGGPLPRAAGRVSAPLALVLEPDPLARLLVGPAVAALGFAVAHDVRGDGAGGPAAEPSRAGEPAWPPPPALAAVFLPLRGAGDCRRAAAEVRRLATPPPLVVLYGSGPQALLSAHREHRCCDQVLQLTASAAGPCFAHPPAVDAVVAAGLSAREADVLVLLLHGLTTPAVGARLGIAASTARTHCRAVLRKLGAGDRRALRARLLAGPGARP
jgi:DNA-binding CsgD family transcriptional regulator